MCIAIFNHKDGEQIGGQALINSFENNPDGAGLMWVEKGKLKTFKSFYMDEWIEKYNWIKENLKDTHIVLHTRIATSGKIDTANLHPFIVRKGKLGFVHNGVISGLGNTELSDTHFFNMLLKGLSNNFLGNISTMSLIGGFIGNSKLIFLNNKNNFEIVNDDKGDYIGLNWFSNTSHSRVKIKYDYNYSYGKSSCDSSTNSCGAKRSIESKVGLEIEDGKVSKKTGEEITVDNEKYVRYINDTKKLYQVYNEEINDYLVKNEEITVKEVEDGVMCPHCVQDTLDMIDWGSDGGVKQKLVFCSQCGYEKVLRVEESIETDSREVGVNLSTLDI